MSEQSATPPENPKASAKAAKAYVKATRPWYKKKRWIGAIVVVVFGIAAAAGGGGSDDDTPTAKQPEVASTAKADDSSKATEVSDEKPATSKPKATAKPKAKKPEATSAQKNALRAAENYLDFAPFSYKGLIEQLSSDAGDGYDRADATYAADHVDADWKEQAAKAAQNYLDFSPFSRQGLIEQLTSDAGDGYTMEQATYGVDKAGL